MTYSPVSHIGVVLYSHVSPDLEYISLIESTSIGDGFAGVSINRLSTRVAAYTGKIWVLPLSKKTRFKLDTIAFTSFLVKQEGKPYDMPQAILSALDGFVPSSNENFTKMFCSELVAEALEKGEVIGPVNASEQTPADVVSYPIYGEPYQISGENSELFKE